MKYAKNLFFCILSLMMVFTYAVFPAHAEAYTPSQNAEVFIVDGQEYLAATYSADTLTRVYGASERTIGIQVYTSDHGVADTLVYDVSCTFVHHYNSTKNSVEITSLRTNVHTDAGYGFTHEAISYLYNIGAMDVKLSVLKDGVVKQNRIKRCYSDGSAIDI